MKIVKFCQKSVLFEFCKWGHAMVREIDVIGVEEAIQIWLGQTVSKKKALCSPLNCKKYPKTKQYKAQELTKIAWDKSQTSQVVPPPL